MPTPLRTPCLLLITLALAGCGSFGFENVRLNPLPNTVDDDERTALSQLPYPAEVEPTDLDIVLTRHRGHVQLLNRSIHEFDDVYLWLNQQYVAYLPKIKIGSNPSIDLEQFVNQHREIYPSGTLLAPDKGRRIVLGELFDPATGQRYRLVVRDKTS